MSFVSAQPPEVELERDFDSIVKKLQWSRVCKNVYVATETPFFYALVSLRTTDVDPTDQVTLGGSRFGERFLVGIVESEDSVLYLRLWIHKARKQQVARFIPPVNLSYAVRHETLMLRSNIIELPGAIPQISKEISILSQANCVFAELAGIQVVYLLEKCPSRAAKVDGASLRRQPQSQLSHQVEASGDSKMVGEQKPSIPVLPPLTVFLPNFEVPSCNTLDSCWTLDSYPVSSVPGGIGLVEKEYLCDESRVVLQNSNASETSTHTLKDPNGIKALETLLKYNEDLRKSRRLNERRVRSVLSSTQNFFSAKDEASSDSF
eukprot:jgi/Galph1/195/GphlegSOOS_G4954.1